MPQKIVYEVTIKIIKNLLKIITIGICYLGTTNDILYFLLTRKNKKVRVSVKKLEIEN